MSRGKQCLAQQCYKDDVGYGALQNSCERPFLWMRRIPSEGEFAAKVDKVPTEGPVMARAVGSQDRNKGLFVGHGEIFGVSRVK
jgi:hypothetical protein